MELVADRPWLAFTDRSYNGRASLFLAARTIVMTAAFQRLYLSSLGFRNGQTGQLSWGLHPQPGGLFSDTIIVKQKCRLLFETRLKTAKTTLLKSV